MHLKFVFSVPCLVPCESSLRHRITISATSGMAPWWHGRTLPIAWLLHVETCIERPNTWRFQVLLIMLQLIYIDLLLSWRFISYVFIFSLKIANIRTLVTLDCTVDMNINKYSIFMLQILKLFKWLLNHCFMLRKKTLWGFARFDCLGYFNF